MKRITIIDGHPDPSEGHLTHALAQRYAEAAFTAGSDVRRIDVAQLDFPLLREPEDFYKGEPVKPIQDAQRDIKWADHIVIFYPLWNGDMPALLKAFIEQTFRPGFAVDYGARYGLPKALLRGKSARIVVTMGMPALLYRGFFGEHSLKSLEKNILWFAGVRPVRETLIGSVGEATDSRRRKWLKRMERVVAEDTRSTKRQHRRFRRFARAGLLLAGAYAGYAASAWLQYGKAPKRSRGDRLLDGVMPEYEVSVHHRIAVDAPASVTFDAMRDTDFQRSPIVRALLRSREALMRANHVEVALPHGLLEQMTSLGWAVVAETHDRELLLGTATQPWKANPVFRALPASEFVSFSDPGYAKIAVTLRVDEVTPQKCNVHTETRVTTTDPVSREKFRRYWALLSPGIAMIRLVLLQQIKREAERRAEVAEPLHVF